MASRPISYKPGSETRRLASQNLDCPQDQDDDPFKGGPYYLDNPPTLWPDDVSQVALEPKRSNRSLDYPKGNTPKH